MRRYEFIDENWVKAKDAMGKLGISKEHFRRIAERNDIVLFRNTIIDKGRKLYRNIEPDEVKLFDDNELMETLMLEKDFKQFEAGYIPVSQTVEIQKELLDLNNPDLPKQLKIAVRCWLEFVSKGLSDDKAFKDQIFDWLRKEYKKSELSDAAIKRLATILNPNPKGGAPKTPIKK